MINLCFINPMIFKRRRPSLAFLLSFALFIGACSQKSPSRPLSRLATNIMGGEIVSGNLRSSVALLDANNSVCSGVLVHARMILTAAHCVSSVGNAITLEDEKGGSHTIEVLHVVSNPLYDKKKNLHDLALIVLSEDAGTQLKPVALADALEVATLVRNREANLVAQGRGMTQYKGKNSDKKLRQVIVPFRGNTPHLIRFGTEEKNVLPGDSGGPLFVQAGELFLLVGIHSYISKYENGDLIGHATMLNRSAQCFVKAASPFQILDNLDCDNMLDIYHEKLMTPSELALQKKFLLRLSKRQWKIKNDNFGLEPDFSLSGTACSSGHWRTWKVLSPNRAMVRIECQNVRYFRLLKKKWLRKHFELSLI